MGSLNIFLTLFFLLRLYCLAIAESVAPQNNDLSLIWGPFRPNLYFGMRPRIPETLLMGLMWARVDNDHGTLHDLRHTCEQNEGMEGYGWTFYDPRLGGSQVVNDTVNKLDLTTELVKMPGGQYGGNWAVRVKGRPRPGAPDDLQSSAIFYASMEQMSLSGKSKLECANGREDETAHGAVVCHGVAAKLGSFNIRIVDNHSISTTVKSSTVQEEKIWQAKELFLGLNRDQSSTNTGEPGIGNMHFVQKTFKGSFEFDILYSSGSTSENITSSDITKGIELIHESFNTRFDSVFTPKSPFLDQRQHQFSQYLLSNLLGGIGYFFGDSYVDRSLSPAYEETELNFWEEASKERARLSSEITTPQELFTSVPSRPFFPRGFFWDEGFHLQVILDWDMDLALEILESWFALMDADGWIAREQILGPEARSKVPPEFQVQYPQFANPPALFLVLTAFIDKLTAKSQYSGSSSVYLQDHEAAREYLDRLYPLLKRYYNWFRRTQSGLVGPKTRPGFSATEGYRWRGRTPQHTLTSGLDDYPRAQPPHPGELHVDAISWVGLMADSLRKISNFLNASDDETGFAKQYQEIQSSIQELHWSNADQAYCDATLEHETHKLVCHLGYISLFPFMLGILGTDHPHIGPILDLIDAEGKLWSPYGLRSLSRESPLYGSAENYWRSPIWININYLVLERLLEVAQSESIFDQTARVVYTKLRRNLVSTVYESWLSTGFAWEQYNPETGAGQRTQHFTGWTALVVKIMAFPDLDTGVPNWRDTDDSRLWAHKRFLLATATLTLGFIFRRKLMRLWTRTIGGQRSLP